MRALKLLVVLAVALALTGGATWYALSRQTDDPTTSEGDELCRFLATTDSPLGTVEDRWRRPIPDAPPGWEVVPVQPWVNSPGAWRFLIDFSGAPEGERVEGIEDPLAGIDVERLDRRHEPGTAGHRTRQVITAGRAWIEDAATQARVECPLTDAQVPAHFFTDRPFKGWGIDAAPGPLPDPLPLPLPLARRIGDHEQAGETFPLYEMKPSAGLEHLRSVFAVDSERNLRFHEITDTRTGEVVLHRHADPVPDHPPIADPTGQPVISAG